MSNRRLVLNTLKIIDAGDMSGDLTSTVVGIQGLDNLAVQMNVLSGTPTGTFSIELSADHQEQNGNVTSSGTWIAMSLPSTPLVTAGSPSSIMVALNQVPALYMRVKYTRTSGTGTCDVVVVGKGL